jgi:hypothetical protein
VVNSAPATLDTLNELATALGNDPNFATTTATQIGLKAPSASPALTGTPTAPTASAGTNTTQLATTAFVLANAATSIAGNTGPFTLSTGLANTGNALRAALSSVTNALGADVNLTSSGVYADGPSCAQGTTGVWLAIGTVNVWDTLGSASISCKLWDGTTVVASSLGITAGSNLPLCVTLAGLFTNPTGNIRISCADNNGSPSGRIKASASGNGKDSTLTVVRIA